MPRNPAVNTTVRITPEEALAHATQAEEYLRCAEDALARGDHNAAAGTAVDAGINAADAVAGLNLGARWKGAHDQATGYVERAGPEGKEVARELRRLLPLKNRAHYDAFTISATKAAESVAAARRAVTATRRAAYRRQQ